MMYVIGFNGPPEVGKDSVAQSLAREYALLTTTPLKLVSIVEPLAQQGALLLGVDYTDEWYVTQKNKPQVLFNGGTLREWMIAQTEEFYKPRYGPTFWNIVLMHQLTVQRFNGLLLVSNFGFQYEVDLWEATYGVENFILIQLSRAGKTFDGDSRGWVTAKNTISVMNKENDIRGTTEKLFDRITEQTNWRLG